MIRSAEAPGNTGRWVALLPPLVAAAGFATVAAYLGVLGFDFLHPERDAGYYWWDSLNWRHPFNQFHVPGYALAIALVRGLTLNALPPLAVMMLINLAAFVAAAALVQRILEESGESPGVAALGALCFAFWPLVGIVYAANLQAETLAIALFLAGVLALQRGRAYVGGAFLGLTLVTHKALWPFIGLLAAAELAGGKKSGPARAAGFLGILLLPLTVLWLAGARHHGSLSWIVAQNLKKEVSSGGALPALDGLLGALGAGGLKGALKGSLLLGVAVASAVLLWTALRSRYPGWRAGAAISGAVLLLVLVLNQWEIWAAVRFSKLLALPAVWAAGARMGRTRPPSAITVAILLGCLFASQLAYTWYLARVFFR